MEKKKVQNGTELSDQEIEQVVGGMDDGSPDNAGQILDEYAKKDKQVKSVPLRDNDHQCF